MTAAVRDTPALEPNDDDFLWDEEDYDDPAEWWYEDEDNLWTWSQYQGEEAPRTETVYVVEERDDEEDMFPCLLAGAAVVMAGGVGVGFVLGLLYASQRQRPVPATLYRVASKEVDAKGLADLALAEVV